MLRLAVLFLLQIFGVRVTIEMAVHLIFGGQNFDIDGGKKEKTRPENKSLIKLFQQFDARMC